MGRCKPETKKAWRDRNRKSGICIQCTSKVLQDRTRCAKHLKMGQENNKRLRLIRDSIGLCHYCSSPRVVGKSLCSRHLERIRLWGVKQKRQLKIDVLTHYGNGEAKCVCCGEKLIDFLSIDHINGGGRKHLKAIGDKHGRNFYKWLKKNGFPPGYQTLCMNCNFGKRNNKDCPHKLLGVNP